LGPPPLETERLVHIDDKSTLWSELSYEQKPTEISAPLPSFLSKNPAIIVDGDYFTVDQRVGGQLFTSTCDLREPLRKSVAAP
jgi:hypothetical protein